MEAGSLTVDGSVRVGQLGTGTFDQWGGTVTINGNDPDPLENASVQDDGDDSSGRRKARSQTLRPQCPTGQYPGLLVGIKNMGYYNLDDGLLKVTGDEIIGSRTTNEEIVDRYPVDEIGGHFSQQGGTHKINGNLFLAKEKASFGLFNLWIDPEAQSKSGNPEFGLVDVQGFGSVGHGGWGYFYQDGGTVKIKGVDRKINLRSHQTRGNMGPNLSPACYDQQSIGFTIGREGLGEYYLSHGELLVSQGEVIGLQAGGSGYFEHSSGSHFVGGTMIISRDEGSLGRYALKGGALVVRGGLVNNDTFDYSGGSLLAKVTNNRFFNITGTAAKTITGDFYNTEKGEMKADNTNISFTRIFKNSGKYESLLSNNTFKYLTVNPTGYLVVGAGDFVTITGDLYNLSTKNTSWNTRNANLKFSGNGKHHFKTGSDKKGPGEEAYKDNFAWHTLTIEGGTVYLRGHLYADQIIGVTADDDKINNLYSYCGIGIYYDATVDLDNPNNYLVGKKLYNPWGKQVGSFTSSGYVSLCN